jgi:aromatic-L-amino-acid decarboxylase
LKLCGTARHDRLGEDFARGVIYTSDQAHHSVAKAATLAGFPSRAVRALPTDPRFRIDLDALAAAVAEDRARGLTPAVLVGSAGTTNTGAVDPLPALADLAARERLWFHVDAAYGGFFMLTARGRAALHGIERADSVTLDPHKGLFLPYGNGCLLVRDVETLRRSHGSAGDYLPEAQHDPDCVDYAALSPELSRGFRGLSVWLPLKLHGFAAFREALDEKLDLARHAADELRRIPEIEIVAEPELSLVAFRHRAPGRSPAERDALNRRLLQRVNARQRVHISGAVVGGAFVLRFCVVVFRTHQRNLDEALDDLRAAIADLA